MDKLKSVWSSTIITTTCDLFYSLFDAVEKKNQNDILTLYDMINTNLKRNDETFQRLIANIK